MARAQWPLTSSLRQLKKLCCESITSVWSRQYKVWRKPLCFSKCGYIFFVYVKLEDDGRHNETTNKNQTSKITTTRKENCRRWKANKLARSFAGRHGLQFVVTAMEPKEIRLGEVVMKTVPGRFQGSSFASLGGGLSHMPLNRNGPLNTKLGHLRLIIYA